MDHSNRWHNPVEDLKPGVHNLLNNITSSFSTDLQAKIIEARIKFLYDNRPLPLRTPVADLATNEIIVQDVHMAFLWCCSYATVAINSMYYDKAFTMEGDIVTFNDRPEMEKVDLTIKWARSLTQEVTLWPEEAARPDQGDVWTDSANNLYMATVGYLLLHEIGHLILHTELKDLMASKKQNPYLEISEADRMRIYNAEVEADEFALNQLLSTKLLDDVRLIKYLGAVLGQLSNCYLLSTPDTRGGSTHPDLDDRIRAVLAQSKLDHEADVIQLKAHVSVGLQLFLTLTGKPFIPEKPEDAAFKQFEDLENYLFGLISAMKNAARERDAGRQ